MYIALNKFAGYPIEKIARRNPQKQTMVYWIQEPIKYGLDLSGIDLANFKILLCTMLSFPFSAVFKRLPDHSYTLKNVYIVLVSSFYVFGILQLYQGLFTLMIASLGTYFITRYFRTDSMPWINFIFLMGFLSYNHVNAQFFKVYDPTTIDITGALMVMVMKLISFGWSIQDGRGPKENLTSYTKSRVIKKHPNILPYLGYSFFYASLLTGPAFDYADYDRFIHNTLFEDVPESRRPGKRKRRIPRSGRVALKKVLQGFGWGALFVTIPKYISWEYMLSDAFMKNHNFIYRVFYLWALYFLARLKYYTIWTIAEGACILCGIGYNGYDSTTDSFKWDRVQNIDPWAYETSQNVHTCLEAWNMNTNKWLKHFVYMRMAKKGNKPGFKSTLTTFVTSAFWHGTRPGYYMTFVMGALLQTVGKLFRRNLRPIFIDKDGNKSQYKPLYDTVCYIVTHLSFSFITQPFVLLDFPRSFKCWSTVYFYVIIGTGIVFGIFRGPWGKQTKDFLAQYHMSPVEVKHPSHLNNAKSDDVLKILNSHITKERDLLESPALGVPSLEDLERFDAAEVDEGIADFVELWQNFKKQKGDVGMSDAYKNFVDELDEIFVTNRDKLQAKMESDKLIKTD